MKLTFLGCVPQAAWPRSFSTRVWRWHWQARVFHWSFLPETLEIFIRHLYLFQCLWIQLLKTPGILEKSYYLIFHVSCVSVLWFAHLAQISLPDFGGGAGASYWAALSRGSIPGTTQTRGNPLLHQQQHQTVQEIHLKSMIAINTLPLLYWVEDSKTIVECVVISCLYK